MMRFPPRRRCPDLLGPIRHRTHARRSLRSSLESLEGRQLLSSVAPAPPATARAAEVLAAAPVAPRVSYVQFQPLTGRVRVSFTGDVSGLDPAQLTNPANYSLVPIRPSDAGPSNDPSRPGVGVVLVPQYKVTGVSLTPNPAPGQPQSLLVIINNNQPIRPGFFRFTIRAAGIVDGAGVALDGAYRGVFPSGNGNPGSDFVADLATVKNTVQPALPIARKPPGPSAPNGVKPAPVFFPTTRETLIKIVGNNNRKSRLLGGGNANVVPLPGQNFPGTFRLPGTSGSQKAKGDGKPRG